MPVPAAYSLAADTSASTPTCSVGNTITLTGAIPSSGYNGALRTIHAAVSDGDIFPIRVYGTDAGGAASVELMVSYVSATKVATITSVLTEVGAASPVVLTAITAIELIQSVDQVSAPRGHIEFDDPAYMTYSSAATTTVTVAGGRGWIDDEYLEWTTAQASGTVTLVAGGGLMYVYLYNNAGTVDQETVTTAPTWDTDRGYWVKTGDTSRRCIGWIWVWEPPTSGTERIMPFVATFSNRHARIVYSLDSDGVDTLSQLEVRFVALSGQTAHVGFTQASLVSITGAVNAGRAIVPEGIIDEWSCGVKTDFENTSADCIPCINPMAVNANVLENNGYYIVRNGPGLGATGLTFFGRHWVPYGGAAPYYAVRDIGGQWGAIFECWGGGMQV